MVIVLPVLLAVNELCERYQEGELFGVVGRLGRLGGETSLGGAEAGRGGGEGEVVLFSWIDDLRPRAGGESRVVFILGVVGGVLHGVVGVAGWSTIASLGETSKGVTWLFLGRLLGESVTSVPDMVEEGSQETFPGSLSCH